MSHLRHFPKLLTLTLERLHGSNPIITSIRAFNWIILIPEPRKNPGKYRKCYFPINHVGSGFGSSTSSRRLTITPCAIVGGLRRISKATANARDAVAGFVLPALPFFLLVRDSYGVKNTRLTIRQLPRSFVILANYPARARTHDRRSCRKCKSRTERYVSRIRRAATVRYPGILEATSIRE